MPNTPKGQATRRRILEAAWELSDARGAEAILGGVTLREIAAAADMAPSAVSYHFATMRDLALAMVEHLAESISTAPVEAINPVLEQLEPDGMATAVRDGATANWAVLTDPTEVEIQRRIDRCYAALADHEDGDTLRRIVGPMVDSWVQGLAQVYAGTLEQMGLALVQPFTANEMARAVSSMVEGLLHQWMCDPTKVRADLVPDMVVALVTATVVPAAGLRTLDELAARLPNPSVASTAPRTATAPSVAGPLFSNGVDGVTLTEVARSLDCSPDEVVAQYGSVATVAAASFARHVPTVVAAVERRRHLDPTVSLADGLYELARCAQADRHCALELLHLRQRAALGTVDPNAAYIWVPLDPALAEPIQRVLGVGDAAAQSHAATVVEHVLAHAATRSRTPIGAITETALRLLPTT